MRKVVTARKMGGSLGVTFPRETVDRLHLKPGDELTVLATADGLLMTPYDPHIDQAPAAYERGARKFRNALRELAR